PEVMVRTSKLNEEVPGDPPLPSHARIGIYRNSLLRGTEDLYIDGYTAATDRTTAEANAFATPISGGPLAIPFIAGSSPVGARAAVAQVTAIGSRTAVLLPQRVRHWGVL